MKDATHSHGAALLLVLWMLVLLTGLISVFALTARTEGLQGRFMARSAIARQAAEAGIEVAAVHLQAAQEAGRWVADGRPNAFSFEGHQLQVEVVDETAKVDLNVAPPELLTGLMVAVGVELDRARQLAGAIQDWRDEDDLINVEGGAEDPQYASARLPYGAKDRSMESTSELRLVLGMDAALYAKLLPHVTIYTGQAQPDATFASEIVLRALGLPPEQVSGVLAARGDPRAGPSPAQTAPAPLAPPGSGTYSISSRATRPDGTRVQIEAVIRMGGGGGFGQLYLPLSWRVGESD